MLSINYWTPLNYLYPKHPSLHVIMFDSFCAGSLLCSMKAFLPCFSYVSRLSRVEWTIWIVYVIESLVLNLKELLLGQCNRTLFRRQVEKHPQKHRPEWSGANFIILAGTKYQRVSTLYAVSTAITFGEEDLVLDHITDHSVLMIVCSRSFSHLAT